MSLANEIAAMSEIVHQVKLRHGYSQAASIHKMFLGPRKFTLGFNFKPAAVGDVYHEEGVRFEVVALV